MGRLRAIFAVLGAGSGLDGIEAGKLDRAAGMMAAVGAASMSIAPVSSVPGSSSGRRLRLKEKGAQQGAGKPRGDLYAVVSVQVPSEISPEAKQAMEEFARLTKK